MPNVIATRRRPFICRFWLSYVGWRAIYGRWNSLKAAWLIARL